MTTTPKYFDITLDGQKARMCKPTTDQAIALGMIDRFDLPEMEQLKILADLFASLLETTADRVVFLAAMARGNYTVEDFIATFRTLTDAPADTAAGDGATAKKRAVKRAASPRTVSGRTRATGKK
jgi:hypothetical protein